MDCVSISCDRTIVITIYGHDKTVDQFSVMVFDGNDSKAKAEAHRDAINGLTLEGTSWVFAEIISENVPYSLDLLFPANMGLFLKMDDRSIQKVLMEIDSVELVKALKGADDAVKDCIFRNCSKRAAEMLKDDMECMSRVKTRDIKESQKKITAIIRHLEAHGEIACFDKEATE